MQAHAVNVIVEVDENGDTIIQLPRLIKSQRVRVVDASGEIIAQVEAITQETPATATKIEESPASEDEALAAWRKKREEYRQKFIAAGLMREDSGIEIPEGARRLTVEERMTLGTLPPSARSSLDIINEDREDRA
jgi:hypothetical protein